ncbi:MAG: CoA pyrophosphatase [Candidatus Nitrosotenuis sp.]|nr:MAG: CoA pyrophosphatase [Candidatus Nitrosotenuis sp.]
MSLGVIRKLLATDILPDIEDHTTKHSAVLIVIHGQECRIVMTEKPQTMEHHAGEISFPGGKISPADSDLLDTAIRETREEISLHISRQDVIGQLKPVTTLNSGFTILPFVAVLDDMSDLQPNEEVAEILHIPAIPFLKTISPDPDPHHHSISEMYTFSYQSKIVWGASARILKQMADIFAQNKLI